MRLFAPVVTAVVVVTTPTAFAQDTGAPVTPTAASVVDGAVGALQEISAVSYRATLTASGVIADQAPTLEGDILLEARPGADIPLAFRGKGTITPPAGAPESDVQRFHSAYDGKTAFGLDYDSQTLYTSEVGTGGLDLLTGTLELIVDAFVVEAPLAEERAAFTSTLLEPVEIDGVLCNVVEFQYMQSAEAGVARWFFGIEDSLPRRVQRVLMIPAGEATITYDVTSLNTSPEIGDDAFAIAAPDGFKTELYDTTGLLPVGSMAPDFSLQNDAGETVTLSELRGQVVVLDFWATWCGPCKVAMPDVEALHKELADQPVAIFGVNCWEQGPSQTAVEYFRTESSYTYGLLLEADDVANDYKVRAIPTFYVIGPDGTIAYRTVGAVAKDALREVIAEALPAS